MRTLRRNKQTIKYATLVGEEPVYVLDENGDKIVDYIDDDGNVYYRDTGDTHLVYSDPVETETSISYSGNEVETVEFGVDVTGYDATILFDINENVPILETSLVYIKNEPYKVAKIKPSLNFVKILLSKMAK